MAHRIELLVLMSNDCCFNIFCKPFSHVCGSSLTHLAPSGTRQFDTFSVGMFDTFSGPTFDTFSVDLTHLAELTHLA